jgi:alpha-amylase/alpha-mannosidase (GH57 family)
VEQYICIHGHFYQPPRANPWLESVQVQDAAYPYHDWNERITAECYAANAAARILGGKNRIAQIVNNYARISFDFGPTLLSWLQKHEAEVYEAILAADRESQKRFSGHGSALAQAYNHLILPLANRRDKYTQVLWGIQDFQHRFGRAPEGMWLPETAVDLETLDILAELGIRFTILAPHQVRKVRPLGGHPRPWCDLGSGGIDPTMAYEVCLPSGLKMSVFFYDSLISRAIAFEGLLDDGDQLARRLAGAFVKARTWPQLVHIATDGETYGHHHRYGDMALAYALQSIEGNRLGRLTNYGEFLDKHPPTYEVEIVENTSWSCAHGVERWRSDCGCNSGSAASGGRPGWNQGWRAPLRAALDWLRDTLAPRFEETGRLLLRDPWAARDDYIAVLLDRSPESVARFFDRHAAHPLGETEKSTALKLLELQSHAMLMYTSCGWFFDDISGIETVQILQHAGRVLQLAEELFGSSWEPSFLERLERAQSNVPERRDGRRIYEQLVKPAVVDWKKVVAHYAMSSLFDGHADRTRVHCYEVARDDYQLLQVGKARLVVGRARVASIITHESALLTFGFLHLGDQSLFGGVREFAGHAEYRALVHEATEAFAEADFPTAIRCLDRHLGPLGYSLKSLFRDEQRQIVNRILQATLAETEAVYRQLYVNHTPLLRYLMDLGIPLTVLSVPLPKAVLTATEFILNIDLRRALQSEETDLDKIQRLLQEAKTWQVILDTVGLAYVLKQRIQRLAEECRARHTDLVLLQRLEKAVDLARSLPFAVDFSQAQNIYHALMHMALPIFQSQAEGSDDGARAWVSCFTALGEKLGMQVPELDEGRTAPLLSA